MALKWAKWSQMGCRLQGRLTLLLGPPGAGKTVFLQMLAGRIKPSKYLRVGGTVCYNGVPAQEFVIERTVGLVDQYDEHIPNLTVHETLEFAMICQMGLRGPEGNPIMQLAEVTARGVLIAVHVCPAVLACVSACCARQNHLLHPRSMM